MLVAVDPALNATGVAVFDDMGVLLRAWVVVSEGRGAGAWAEIAKKVWSGVFMLFGQPSEVVVESMKYYMHLAVDADDLLEINGVAGAVIGYITSLYSPIVRNVKPVEWKRRGEPKHVTAYNVAKIVDMSKVVAPAESLKHNAIDAIGIGLWALKQRNRKANGT